MDAAVSQDSHGFLIPWIGMSPKVAVIGDIILDEYLEGQVNRISPEAPVPVHLVTATKRVLGGAANAALNVRTVGGHVALFSVIGEDEAGRDLLELIDRHQIQEPHIIKVSDRPTIRKTRVTSGVQQLIRVDWEKASAIKRHVQKQLLDRLAAAKFDALLISDYGKGLLSPEFLQEIIGVAKDHKVPVIVDPKGKDFSKYRGVTLITPNRKEACEALGVGAFGPETGSSNGEQLGSLLHQRYGLENILVTLGSKGMVLVSFANDGKTQGSLGQVTHLPAIAQEVFDVSGAGDTVAALMAISLAAKVPMVQALTLANTSAAIVVGKLGTQPVYLHELNAALMVRPGKKRSQRKIVPPEVAAWSVKPLLERQKKVVFTNGCFDLLHSGHVEYLEEAKSKGDILVVGVNSDASVRHLKGPKRPIIKLEHRMQLLAALECVDFVVAFDELTPLKLIETIVPNCLVKGGDYLTDVAPGHPQAIVGADFVKKNGGVVEAVALVPGLSTSQLIDTIVKIS